MRGFAKIMIAGNLTRDPEARTTSSGQNLVSFGVAVNRVYTTGGAKKEEVTFYNCTAWGRTGDTIKEFAHKGTGIILSGRPSQNEWTDRDGNKRTSIEINVEDFVFAGGSDSDRQRSGGSSDYSAGGSASDAGGSSPEEAPITDIPAGEISLDDIPF